MSNHQNHRPAPTPRPLAQTECAFGKTDGTTTNCIDSRCLMAADGQCWICHNGQRYLLRITAANRLILTK